MGEFFTWSTFVTLVLSTSISAIITNVVKHTVDKHLKEQEDIAKREKADHEELAKRRAQDLQEKYINTVKEVVSTEVASIKEDIKEIKDLQDLDQKATVVNLRINMKSIRDRCKKQGFADIADKASWVELYNDYKNMGGNHFTEYVDQWKDEMEKLPTEKKSTKKK